jgi:hypothetical protein
MDQCRALYDHVSADRSTLRDYTGCDGAQVIASSSLFVVRYSVSFQAKRSSTVRRCVLFFVCFAPVCVAADIPQCARATFALPPGVGSPGGVGQFLVFQNQWIVSGNGTAFASSDKVSHGDRFCQSLRLLLYRPGALNPLTVNFSPSLKLGTSSSSHGMA